jgi:ABC-type dipeptide/oligopeptide/nickel transport system permease component
MRRRFFVRRLVMLLASLLIASFVIFAALYLAPGNPLAALSGAARCHRPRCTRCRSDITSTRGSSSSTGTG